jgi:integrase
MRSSAYLSASRCGVFLVRFVLPHDRRLPGEPRDFKFSTLTKDPRNAKSIARRLRVLFELYLLQNVRVEREALIAYLRNSMTKQKLSDLAPFNAEPDGDGGWKFSDVKPDDIPAIDAFLEAVTKHTGSKPLSQVALAEPLPEQFHEPGRLSAAARSRVSKHIAEYLKYEEAREADREIGEKKVPQVRTRLKPFLDRFGQRQIGTLTPADMEQYKKDLVYLPVDAPSLRSAINLSFDEIIKRSRKKLIVDNSGDIALTITANTLDGYITVAKNFLEHAKKQYAINPLITTGFDVKVKAREGVTKRAFTQLELEAIFGSAYYVEANYNKCHQYWVPLLGAFCGARLNEIAQLQLDDIQQDDAGLWYINITDSQDDDEDGDGKSLKNEESRRIIPVHQKLLDLGFIDFVKSQRASAPTRKAAIEEAARNAKPNSKAAKARYTDSLFELSPGTGDKYGKEPGRWFNKNYLDEYLALKKPEISFHSFRHRFVTSLAQAIIDGSGLAVETIIAERIPESVVLRRLCGHSSAHVMTAGRSQYDVHTDTYTGAFSIESMKRVIDRLNYPGVEFHLYSPPVEGKRKRMKKPTAKKSVPTKKVVNNSELQAGTFEVTSEEFSTLFS